jgi:hypothetical protein
MLQHEDPTIAITHDDEWASVLEDGDDTFLDEASLISRMEKKFEVNRSDGE